MAAQLESLETWVAALLERLGPAGSRQLALQISHELRQRNMRRMRAQTGPDGAAWEPRKKPRPAPRAIRYVYEKLNGRVRELEMSSYRRGGGRIIGYDKVAGGIRTMIGARVLRKVQPQYGNGGASPASKRRAQQMFTRLSTARWLKAEGNPGAAIVTFADMKGAQRIAMAHQYGGPDKVNKQGTTYDYPARELLGFADDDLEDIRNQILARVAGKS